MSNSEFKTNLLKYAGINYDTHVMIFPGNITCDNLIGNTQGNVIAQLPAVGSMDLRGNVIGAYANVDNLIGTNAVIGGNATPSADDVSAVITAAGGESDAERAAALITELEGKDINELIASGKYK